MEGRYREPDRRYQSARDERKIMLTGSPMENIGRFGKVVAAPALPGMDAIKRWTQCETLTGSATTTSGHVSIEGKSNVAHLPLCPQGQDYGVLLGKWKPPSGPNQPELFTTCLTQKSPST